MHNSEIYRYSSFTLATVMSDMGFHGGVAPEGNVGIIDLTTADQQKLQWPHAGSKELLLLTFGSRTCPATISTIPDLKGLYEKYGDSVEFAYLYVREAHPGNVIPQHRTIDEKITQACILQSEYQIPWKVAVDTLEGDIHHRLATRPNASYLIDVNGMVIFRTLFAADTAAIGNAIKNHLAGMPQTRSDRNPIIYPVLKLIGLTWEVVGRAGETAMRDLLIRTPFLYFPSRIAVMLKWMSPFARGSIAMGMTIAIIVLVSWIATRVSQG